MSQLENYTAQETPYGVECEIESHTHSETPEPIILFNHEYDIEWNLFLEQVDEQFTEFNDSDFLSDFEEHSNNNNGDANMASELGKWASSFSITAEALSALLTFLRLYHPSLPKDPRTLLKTPKQVDVKTIQDGSYCHFGIQNCLL